MSDEIVQVYPVRNSRWPRLSILNTTANATNGNPVHNKVRVYHWLKVIWCRLFHHKLSIANPYGFPTCISKRGKSYDFRCQVCGIWWNDAPEKSCRATKQASARLEAWFTYIRNTREGER